MAYQHGDVILDTHFDGFANSLNTVLGSGSTSYGYGQGSTVAGVDPGAVISATQWATLLARINSAADHQGTTLTAIPAPTAGNTIQAFTALQTNLISINMKRFNAAAAGADITTNGYHTRTAGWQTAIYMTYTINFASEAAARYFFNAGGQIRLNASRSGGSGHWKDIEWSNLCSQMGTIVISNGYSSNTVAGTGYNSGFTKIGGSGSVNILHTTLGYYSASESDVAGFRQYEDNAPYGGNYIQINLRKPAPYQLVVTVCFVDGEADSPWNDIVDGTLATSMVLRQPSTTHISNSWGTPTMSCSVTGS